MAHKVVLTRSLRATRDPLDKPIRASYETVVRELQLHGCRAGGYKMMSEDSAELPLCCRHLRYEWRLLTWYPEPGLIAIEALCHHNSSETYERLAELIPGLSSIGRRRSNKPPCCQDQEAPRVIGKSLVVPDSGGV